MLPFLEHEDASFLFASSPVSWNNTWHELRALANRAGVSTDYLCSLIEDAICIASNGKSVRSDFASADDLDYVAHLLSETDFSFAAKVTWNESEHPRDAAGRFTNGNSGTGTPADLNFAPQIIPHVDHTYALHELHQLHNEVEKLYPQLTSRWKGELRIAPQSELKAAGSKSWHCRISVAQEMFASPARKICVMIHESMHALSPTTEPEYLRAPKWEEGAIEGAVRLHRNEILRQIGTKISETYFDDYDLRHPYNKYYNALEDIRRALGQGDVRKFYDNLMITPADKMEDVLLSQASQLSPREKFKFDRRFAVAKAILDDKFKP